MTYTLLLLPLLVAAWYDYRTRTIPDLCWISVACLGLFHHPFPLLGVLHGVLLGSFLLFGAVLLGGIGGGDVKLCAAFGAAVGFLPGLNLVAAALVFLIVWGRLHRSETLPFAPFLSLCYLLYLIKELILI